MKEYTITIKVKEKNLDDVVGMIKSNSDYDGGLIESMDWESHWIDDYEEESK